jgi:hypothetical protein
MTRQYSHGRRLEVAMAVFDMDKYWAEIFPEGELKDLCFCDLFTQLWAYQHAENQSTNPEKKGNHVSLISKTELYKWMPNISPRTAVKYVQIAIERGMLEEHPNEIDRRVRLINLSPTCVERIEKFLDYTCLRFSNSKAESTRS